MPDTKRTLTITPSLAHLAEELRPLGLSLNDLLRLALWCRPTAEMVAAHLSAADLPPGLPSPRYAFRLPQTGWARIAQLTEELRRQGRQGLSRSQVVRALVVWMETSLEKAISAQVSAISQNVKS
ncbi:hypothetical protein GC175_33165 [bacterium]|nr:hypothetical protein [bacterium]